MFIATEGKSYNNNNDNISKSNNDNNMFITNSGDAEVRRRERRP